MAAAFPEGAYARDASPRFPGPSRNFSENGRLKVSKTDIEKASGLPQFPYAAFLSTASHSGQSGTGNLTIQCFYSDDFFAKFAVPFSVVRVTYDCVYIVNSDLGYA